MPSLTAYLLSLAPLLPLITAHGHVSGIVVDGKWYTGWNAEMKYQNPLPATAGWQADNLDNGFITPSQFATADIICHKSAKNANAYITAKPGSKVVFQWNTWPVSHKGEMIQKGKRYERKLIRALGPVFDYIANCNGDCLTVDKTKLSFTKYNEGAWISGNDPGTWVTDDLVKNNNSWTTTIPANLAPGNYVIRHEVG
jgi:lytic cellulose monooxygenase (C1-hydroxylating)